MAENRQYVMVDKKRFRRHSAPEPPVQFNLRIPAKSRPPADTWCRASVSDFSILLEHQSESCSSLELDTSNLSVDLTPVPTPKSSISGSYKNLHAIGDDNQRRDSGRSPSWNFLSTWYLWRSLIFNQTVAGCLALMMVSNDSIKDAKHPITNVQNLLHYILLSVLWTTHLAMRNNGRDFLEILRYSGLRYLCLSVLHVEVNYLTLSSLRYASSLGNQMIDCVAASLSLIIAYVLLEVQLQVIHVLGFVLAIAGGFGFSTVANSVQNQESDDTLLGDVLRIACGICVAYGSVAEEIIVKATGHTEYLGMVGLIGSFVCGLQVITLERSLPTSCSYWFCIFVYSLAQFFFHSLTPRILREGSATGLHLTLISAGFYTHILGFLVQGKDFHFFYLLSYVTALIGSFLFAARRTPIGTQYCFPIQIVVMKSG